MTRDSAQLAFVRQSLAAARGVAPPPSSETRAGDIEAITTEADAAPAPRPPQDAFIADSLERADANLQRDPGVDDAARAVALDAAKQAYGRLRDRSGINLADVLTLEAIQVFDGSRPAVLFGPDGRIDPADPELGTWAEDIALHGDDIAALAGQVALIRGNGGPQGSGFRAGPGLIVTNRHVLEAIAAETPGGWQLAEDAEAVFATGAEAITGVAFAGALPIGGAIDLSRLDAAVLRVAGAAPGAALDGRLGAGVMTRDRPLHVIGYPLGWGDAAGLSGAERLYRGKIGKLCWSPGTLTVTPGQAPDDARREWAFGYDISTLPGNSGSVVADLRDNPAVALGLHIGGATQLGNWAHWLAGASNLLRPAGLEFET
ncbi:trypsin-like peptidase domain-containing protein [Paracoccaceae bacterium Fryx2]|nr:trypsin-like peptidase domain-containing protein [Paracoccaceae bacterium Fryx2]